jgi:uncharacterized repeat protein (TIGR01451 family)
MKPSSSDRALATERGSIGTETNTCNIIYQITLIRMIAFEYFDFTRRRAHTSGPFRARGGAGRTFKAAVSGASLFAALALAAAGRAQQQQGNWQPASAMLIPRRLLTAAALEGKAYALGGCGSACFEPPLHNSTFEETRVEVYDPSSDTWVVKNPMPTILFGAAAVALKDKIYTLGGVLSGNVVQEYEPASDSWTLLQRMPTPRYGLAAVALDGKIYAIGGNGPSNAVEVYDPATDTWSSRAPLKTARVFLAAAVAGGKIYAIGGSPDCCGNSQTNVVEVYDPAADAEGWKTAAPLPMALQLSAAAGINDLIYTFGGFIPGSGVTGATFQYTPGIDAWTRQPDMPTPRDEAPAVVLNGDAFVLGGAVQCHCQALPQNEGFTPAPRPPPTPMADLAVDLTGGALSACAPARFRIAVTNHGPDPASGALVEDRFPPELSGIAWTCEAFGGARCGAKMGGGSDRIEERVNLPAGGSVVYEVSATLAASASGSLADVATVEPPAGVVDPQPNNNRSAFAAPIACTADLEVHSVAPPALVAGATAPYLVTVTNNGRCCATAAVLVVTLQAGLRLVSPLPSGCAASGGKLTCSLGTICPGQVKLVSASMGAPCGQPAGPVKSLAQVTSATCDPVLPNNSDSGLTQVAVVADYSIVKTASSAPTDAGSSFTYQLVVTNNGPSCPPGVTVVDAFSSALTGARWCLGSGCTPIPQGNLLAVVDLDRSASATFLATATLPLALCIGGPPVPQCTSLPISPYQCACTVSNTACVAAPAGVDPDPRNNCSTVTTVVLLVPRPPA